MNEHEDALRRFRSETPPPAEASWAQVRRTVASQIAAELDPRPPAGRAGGRPRSRRLMVAVLAGLVCTAAAAYGATALIGVGSPAPNPPAVSTPSNIRLLGLRVPDPAGGPPWGIRLALSHTPTTPTTGVAIQIGRIRGEQMGFIGQDSVFNDDQLFHPAGPNSALITPADYPISGTPQHPNLRDVYRFALTLPGVASAYQGCGTTRVPIHPTPARQAIERDMRTLKSYLAVLRRGGAPALRLTRQLHDTVPVARAMLTQQLERDSRLAAGFTVERSFSKCPAADLRTIVFGFSGLNTSSISIDGQGVHQTEALSSADDGFYLFVLPNHWSYSSVFTTTATCSDGKTTRGVAAPGTPHPPDCNSH